MKGLPDVVFNNFQKGIAPSPYVGIGLMTNVDIASAPGSARVGFAQTKQSGTTITGLTKWITRNVKYTNQSGSVIGNSDIYALDGGQNVYKSTDSGVTWSAVTHAGASTGNGDGAVIWKNYLFVAGNTALDVYGPLDSSPAWTNVWSAAGTLAQGGPSTGTTAANQYHPMYWAKDDKLYICHGPYVDSVVEKASKVFAPGDATTYTYSTKAITVPTFAFIKSTEQLGDNLLFGTWNGGTGDLRADIYPWDKISAAYGTPLKFSGDGINAMRTIGQMTYVLAGQRGQIYATNGYNIFPFKTLNLSGADTYLPYPGAIANVNGRPYFGFAPGTTYANGIYSLDSASLYGQGDAVLNCENITSQGSASTQTIGALFPLGEYQYLIGWQDSGSATQGIDLVAGSGYRSSSYSAVIDTDFRRVGTPTERRKFTQIFFQLEQPLTTGQGIKIGFRYDTNASFKNIDTWDYTTYGGITSNLVNSRFAGIDSSGRDSAENIQLRIQLTTGSNSTTTPGLLEVRIR